MQKKSICVVGLGYVGLTLAVYLVRKGLRVHGVEISESIIESLHKKESHFFEEGFESEIIEAIDSGLFSFSKDYIHFDSATYYIVTVGTPLNSDSRVNIDSLVTVINNIASLLRDNDVVILRSTVKVGTTREIVKPILDDTGKSYNLGFCPERTLEGSAFRELATLPQVISGIDNDALHVMKDLFSLVSSKLVVTNSVEEAEMVKLLNNSERDLIFALANEIALMAEAKGLDAYRIIEAANQDYPRSNLKKPGPVGGPCLEKDSYILTEGFLSGSYTPTLFTAARKVNELVIQKGLNRFFDNFETIRPAQIPKKITVLGFAFKGSPPTGDIRGSLVYKVIDVIKKRFPNSDIIGHDYQAKVREIDNLGVTLGTNDINEALLDSEIVILQNNHPRYKQENWEKLSSITSDDCFIYDFWNQLLIESVDSIRYYLAFGKGRVYE